MKDRFEELARECFGNAMNDKSLDLSDRLTKAARGLAIIDYAFYLKENNAASLRDINFTKKELKAIADVLGEVIYRRWSNVTDTYSLLTKEGMREEFVGCWDYHSITEAVQCEGIEVIRPKKK